MSCIRVTLSREGGFSCSVNRIGGFTTSVYYAGGITTQVDYIGGVETKTTRKNGISCRVFQVCKTGIKGRPYLEISPEIIWVLAGWSSNDVYSNTTWNVD